MDGIKLEIVNMLEGLQSHKCEFVPFGEVRRFGYFFAEKSSDTTMHKNRKLRGS